MGFTPLMYAAILDFGSLVKILINAGSNLEIMNERGYTALMFAKFNGLSEIYDILKSANANEDMIDKLRFNNIILDESKKYFYADIIQKEIYCENKEAKQLVNNIFDNIQKYGDFRIELIMTCIALYMLEKNDNNLQIFITNNVDTSVFSRGRLDDGACMVGSYNELKNIIWISNFGGAFIMTQTFLHELVHKIHLSFKDLKLDNLKKAVNNVSKRLEELPKSKGSEYIKNNLINRINNYGYYNTVSSKLLEYLADSISYGLIYKKYKDDTMIKDMKYILAPIYDVFDKEISPKLKEYILNNDNFNRIKFSDLMKKKLREFKNNAREKGNYTYKIQQIPSDYKGGIYLG